MAHCGLWHTHTSQFPSSIRCQIQCLSGFLMQRTNTEKKTAAVHWKYTNVFCHVDVLLHSWSFQSNFKYRASRHYDYFRICYAALYVAFKKWPADKKGVSRPSKKLSKNCALLYGSQQHHNSSGFSNEVTLHTICKNSQGLSLFLILKQKNQFSKFQAFQKQMKPITISAVVTRAPLVGRTAFDLIQDGCQR